MAETGDGAAGRLSRADREASVGHKFADIAFTPTVRAVQEQLGSRRSYARLDGPEATNDRLGEAEGAFLAARDSFYMATVGETGWPYLQHRGGPPGFVRVLSPTSIGFADFRGNRQYVSVGNLMTDDRVALFFMDYANQRRLKLLGRITMIGRERADVLQVLELPGYAARVERGMVVQVEAFDWNCPQHITPRYTMPDIAAATASLRERIAELEAELAARG